MVVFGLRSGEGGKARRGSKALCHHVKEVLLRLGGGEGEEKGVCVGERVFEATLRGGVGGESAEMKGGNGMVKR